MYGRSRHVTATTVSPGRLCAALRCLHCGYTDFYVFYAKRYELTQVRRPGEGECLEAGTYWYGITGVEEGQKYIV